MFRWLRSRLRGIGTRCPECDSRRVIGVPGHESLRHCLHCEATYSTETL